MSKDSIKMVAGIVVVGLALVATFLYGNHQSQEQIHKQQQLENQAREQNAAKPAPVATHPSPPTPSAQPTQPAPTAIPQTGSGDWSLAGLASMLLALRFYLASRHQALQAQQIGVK